MGNGYNRRRAGSGMVSERRLWTAALFAFVGLSGLTLQARGPLLSSFRAAFGVSEAALGLIAPAAAVGYLAAILTVGMGMGRLDVRRSLLFGVAATAVGTTLAGLAPTFLVLVAFVVGRMVGNGVVRGLDRPVLSHLYPDRRARVFNLHSMVWAIGGAAGPLLVTLALALGDWRLTYLIAGAAFLPIAVAMRRLDPPAGVENERAISVAEVRGLLDRPTIRSMGAALVLIVGVESSLFTWLPYYAGGFVPRSTANLLLSTYLLAYVPGRYAFSRLVAVVDRLSLVFGAAALALACLAVAVLAPASTLVLFAAVAGTGFLIAGLFPTLVAWGTDAAPKHSGPVNALAMTAAQAGFFTAPAAIGLLAERFGIAAGMRVPLALLAALVVLVGWLRLR